MSDQYSEIYILMTDADGTMKSIDEPFGVAVNSIEEAERYVREGKYGYSHSYQKIKMFDNKDDALAYSLGLPRLIADEHIAFVIDFLTQNGRTEQMKIRENMSEYFSLPSVTTDNFIGEVEFTKRLMDKVGYKVKLKREAQPISDSVFYSLA